MHESLRGGLALAPATADTGTRSAPTTQREYRPRSLVAFAHRSHYPGSVFNRTPRECSCGLFLACSALASCVAKAGNTTLPEAPRTTGLRRVESLRITSPQAAAAVDAPGLQLGEPYADFGLAALDFSNGSLGRLIWLSDLLREEARVARFPDSKRPTVLLNFFAAWCDPCFSELDDLERLQVRYGPQGLRVVGINFREPGEDASAAIQATFTRLRDRPPNFPMLFDRYTRRTQSLYLGARPTLPTSVLIDASGKVVLRVAGATEDNRERIERELSSRLEPASEAPPNGGEPLERNGPGGLQTTGPEAARP